MTTNTFYANPAVGGDGATYTDDANPTTGLASNGHRNRLLNMFSSVAAIAVFVATKAADAVAAAATAVNAPGTMGTFNGAITINAVLDAVVGPFNTQTGKAWSVGQWVTMTYAPNINYWLWGQITAYDSATGAMSIKQKTWGSTGLQTGVWNIALTSPFDTTLTGRVTTLETNAAKIKARRRLLEKEMI